MVVAGCETVNDAWYARYLANDFFIAHLLILRQCVISLHYPLRQFSMNTIRPTQPTNCGQNLPSLGVKWGHAPDLRQGPLPGLEDVLGGVMKQVSHVL